MSKMHVLVRRWSMITRNHLLASDVIMACRSRVARPTYLETKTLIGARSVIPIQHQLVRIDYC